MAWNYGHHGEPLYVPYPGPRFDRDGREYYELAPVTFREPLIYNDVYYRRDFRHHHPDPGHGGLLIPNREPVLIRREDIDRGPFAAPSWQTRGFLHGEYPVFVVEHHHPAESVQSTLEFHAPQLCCDNCEHRVREALNNFPGVENVVADQWDKKVVVVGRNLQPQLVLHRLQRVLRMDRSSFWQDRRG